jgi:hypothetical protein
MVDEERKKKKEKGGVYEKTPFARIEVASSSSHL